MASEEQQQRVREVADRLVERLAEVWPEGDAHLNDPEAFAERDGPRRAAGIELASVARARGAQRREQTSCPWRGIATYRRHSELTLVMVARSLHPGWAYFACHTCGKGYGPQVTCLWQPVGEMVGVVPPPGPHFDPLPRTFRSVDHGAALDLTVRLGDGLAPTHLARFVAVIVAQLDLTAL